MPRPYRQLKNESDQEYQARLARIEARVTAIKKFGKCAGQPRGTVEKGITFREVKPIDIVYFRDGVEIPSQKKTVVKKTVICRYCRGAHFSARCPKRQRMAEEDELMGSSSLSKPPTDGSSKSGYNASISSYKSSNRFRKDINDFSRHKDDGRVWQRGMKKESKNETNKVKGGTSQASILNTSSSKSTTKQPSTIKPDNTKTGVGGTVTPPQRTPPLTVEADHIKRTEQQQNSKLFATGWPGSANNTKLAPKHANPVDPATASTTSTVTTTKQKTGDEVEAPHPKPRDPSSASNNDAAASEIDPRNHSMKVQNGTQSPERRTEAYHKSKQQDQKVDTPAHWENSGSDKYGRTSDRSTNKHQSNVVSKEMADEHARRLKAQLDAQVRNEKRERQMSQERERAKLATLKAQKKQMEELYKLRLMQRRYMELKAEDPTMLGYANFDQLKAAFAQDRAELAAKANHSQSKSSSHHRSHSQPSRLSQNYMQQLLAQQSNRTNKSRYTFDSYDKQQQQLERAMDGMDLATSASSSKSRYTFAKQSPQESAMDHPDHDLDPAAASNMRRKLRLYEQFRNSLGNDPRGGDMNSASEYARRQALHAMSSSNMDQDVKKFNQKLIAMRHREKSDRERSARERELYKHQLDPDPDPYAQLYKKSSSSQSHSRHRATDRRTAQKLLAEEYLKGYLVNEDTSDDPPRKNSTSDSHRRMHDYSSHHLSQHRLDLHNLQQQHASSHSHERPRTSHSHMEIAQSNRHRSHWNNDESPPHSPRGQMDHRHAHRQNSGSSRGGVWQGSTHDSVPDHQSSSTRRRSMPKQYQGSSSRGGYSGYQHEVNGEASGGYGGVSYGRSSGDYGISGHPHSGSSSSHATGNRSQHGRSRVPQGTGQQQGGSKSPKKTDLGGSLLERAEICSYATLMPK